MTSYAHGLVGVTLDGRYRLDAVLGEGGMGSVFRATHLAMDRKVAVKLLKPHLTSDKIALERFAREARATIKVDSPHAVKVLDFGATPLGDYYMVLEYLDGRTVQRELEIDGAFTPARVAHIARQALAALAAAHDQGLVHRDVKPDNLLLMRQGADPDFTKMLDFGVAKLMQADPSLALTGAGVVFGTPEYMSPEQACGHPLDGRSDLYSLAATMFVMLTGAAMFEADSAIEWLTHHARTPPPHLAELHPELAAYPELDQLLQRCLAKHREQRPATAAEMARLIEAIEPALVRPPGAAPSARSGTASPVATSLRGQRTPTRGSSYFPALRDEAAAEMLAADPSAGRPITSLSALAQTGSAASPDLASELEGSSFSRAPALRRSRRRWLTGAIVAALIGGTIGLAARGSSTDPAPASPPSTAGAASTPPAAAQPIVAVAAVPPPTAPPVAAPASAHSAPPIHSPASSVHAAQTEHSDRGPPSAAAEHLHAAEDALVAGSQLKQLAEADLALRADPRSIRAKYLLGDALIKAGDLDRGCAYLHALAHYAPARERARAAGCPDD